MDGIKHVRHGTGADVGRFGMSFVVWLSIPRAIVVAEQVGNIASALDLAAHGNKESVAFDIVV